MQFESLFFEAFDTFRVVEDLSVGIVTQVVPGTPKNCWQILNHLISWQENQLLLLQGISSKTPIEENETWIKVAVPISQNDVDNQVALFNTQISKVKAIVATLSLHQPDIEFKLKILVDMMSHLSFHLGEIVLIRRQCRNYPMPEDMPNYLA